MALSVVSIRARAFGVHRKVCSSMTMRPFETVRVIGRGRLGGAVAARLQERGVLRDRSDRADLVLLAVPDAAIADVARGRRRRAVGRARERRDAARESRAARAAFRRASAADVYARAGAPNSSTARGPPSRPRPTTRARRARCAGRRRSACGLSISTNRSARCTTPARRSRRTFSSRIHRAAVRAIEAAGAPPEALLPLMQRTMDNHFDLTGPDCARRPRDRGAHLAALRDAAARSRAALSGARRRDAAMNIVHTIADLRRARAAAGAARVGFVPDDGRAARGARVALRPRRGASATRSSPASSSIPPSSTTPRICRRTRGRKTRTRPSPRARESTCSSCRAPTRCTRRDTRRPSTSAAPRSVSKASIVPVISTAWRPSA